ncbi:MAG TPA: hypothetical protein VML56_01580, partial [Burkholderiales bacterium]|nr:hypothetical protein [Burkholderiales bacterium]
MSEALAQPAVPVRAPSNVPGLVVVLACAIAFPLIPYALHVSDYVLNIFMNSVTYAMAVLGM